MTLNELLSKHKLTIESALMSHLPDEKNSPERLHQAMQYAVLNGGKRIRSILMLILGEALEVAPNKLLPIACAVEFAHAHSLVHDDLPALDNDTLRRGKPACHIAFDEATAILAGDALLSLAFETLTRVEAHGVAGQKIPAMLRCFAQAMGSTGLLGGQALDIQMEASRPSLEQLETMYTLKTARLLQAGMNLTLMVSSAYRNKKIVETIDKAGASLGLAFQIHDDIIGLTSNTETLGKQQGSDLASEKPIYPVLTSMEKAEKRRDFLYQQAVAQLSSLPFAAEGLIQLAEFIITRKH